MFSFRPGDLFSFSGICDFRFTILKGVTESKTGFYNYLTILIGISDVPFTINDALQTLTHIVISIIVLKRFIVSVRAATDP